MSFLKQQAPANAGVNRAFSKGIFGDVDQNQMEKKARDQQAYKE